MKIEKTGKPLPATVGETTSRNPVFKNTGNKASAAESSGTSVHLGTTTAQLRNLESSIASTPVVDIHKVAEIKKAISDGRFQVDAGVVADKLISTAQELIAASKH